MKKSISMLFCFLFLLSACFMSACGGNEGNGGTDMTIDKGDKSNPTYTFVTDGELTVSTVSKQDTVNKLQATDSYGRSFGYMN